MYVYILKQTETTTATTKQNNMTYDKKFFYTSHVKSHMYYI